MPSNSIDDIFFLRLKGHECRFPPVLMAMKTYKFWKSSGASKADHIRYNRGIRVLFCCWVVCTSAKSLVADAFCINLLYLAKQPASEPANRDQQIKCLVFFSILRTLCVFVFVRSRCDYYGNLLLKRRLPDDENI